MHFTPLGQMEMAAPTGLISFTASNTVQSAANTRANNDCFHASLLLQGVKTVSNLRTRLQHGENSVVRETFALLKCVNAVSVPFYESKISWSTLWNRLFHACAQGGVVCAIAWRRTIKETL